jgi:hypothetical protein
LPKHFEGKDADALLNALKKAGVNTSSLRKTLKRQEAMERLASG